MSQAIRVVHVIARMNVGGPAVLISDTVRELDRAEFDVRLITGNCGDDEADYLETQAPDIRAIRINGLGRSVSPVNDVMALRSIVVDSVIFSRTSSTHIQRRQVWSVGLRLGWRPLRHG